MASVEYVSGRFLSIAALVGFFQKSIFAAIVPFVRSLLVWMSKHSRGESALFPAFQSSFRFIAMKVLEPQSEKSEGLFLIS